MRFVGHKQRQCNSHEKTTIQFMFASITELYPKSKHIKSESRKI